MEPPVRQSSSNRREERRGNEDRYKPSSSSSRRHDDRYKEDKYKESSSSRRHHSSSKDKKSSSSSSRRSKKGPPLDTIDRLDVTGFFGPGNFHHDGPFDACTPHRNKYNRKAPVAAFPIDGANNTVTGVDPNRDRYASENQIMGRGDSEAFQDFSVPLRGGVGTLGRSHEDASTFDASLKQKPVHGNTSLGLGSSTFLDGAPASKIATDKYNQEQQQMGLSRKKSLAQRFRGGNGAGPAVSRDTKMAVNTAAPAGIAGAGSTLSPTSPRDGYSSSEAVQPEQVQPHTKSSGLLRRVKSLKVGSSRR